MLKVSDCLNEEKNKNRKADCRVLGYMKDKRCYLQLVSSKLM